MSDVSNQTELEKSGFGETFDLDNNDEILEIKSPIDRVTGPYAVVFKELVERWVVVALNVDNKPCLGIRWFDVGGGTPFIRSKPIWFFVPHGLEEAILNQLPIGLAFKKQVRDFLCGTISGDVLLKNSKEYWKK